MALGNSVNATTAGVQTLSSAGVWSGTALTQYNVLTGGTTNLPNSVAPSATSGVPLISQGSSSQPVFGTAAVAGGGTGLATLTANSLQVGNGTSAVTQLAVGATGTVLIGVTAGNPTFSATPTVTSITFGSGTALSNYVDGTFTPTLIGVSSAGVQTYSVQLGTYRRIGNVVILQGLVATTANSGTGQEAIGGLPFTSAGSNNTPVSCLYLGVMPVTTTQTVPLVIASTTTAYVYGVAAVTGALTTSVVQAAVTTYFQASYPI